MKMEFGEDAENLEPNEELGLAARLTKKTKSQEKEKGNTTLTQTNQPRFEVSVYVVWKRITWKAKFTFHSSL